MTSHTQDFEKTSLNQIRNAKRASYNKEQIFSILNDGFIAHAGFVDGDRPIVIPMAYGRIEETLYIHGAKLTRISTHLKEGLAVCLTVTLVDGIVVARSTFHSSMNYRSVVIHGDAFEVTDQTEKETALAKITNNILPGRWDEARTTTPNEYDATTVLKINILSASAKVRTGPPNDKKEDYSEPIWGGVVPMKTVYGIPEDDGKVLAGVNLPPSVQKLIASER